MAVAKKRLGSDDRRAAILAGAMKVIKTKGSDKLTRRAVAAASNCSEALVAHYFGGIKEATKTFMREAKRAGVVDKSAAVKKSPVASTKKVAAKKSVVRKSTVAAPAKTVTTAAVGKVAAKKSAGTSKPPRVRTAKVASRDAAADTGKVASSASTTAVKSAARAPKAPPPMVLPDLPMPPTMAPA